LPSYFLDSSALVKRYHQERGTAWVQSLTEPRSHPAIYISQLAHVEVIAALRRVGRAQRLHPSSVDALINHFMRHISASSHTRSTPAYLLVPLSPATLALAANLCSRYWDIAPAPLRSLDAIQLACALATTASISDELVFVTADTRLGTVAGNEGMRVVNPLFPPTP
jgi:hypothetical protein